MRLTAIVYATESKLPRRLVVSDNETDLAAAAAPEDGETRFDHPGLETIPVKTVMAMCGLASPEEVNAHNRLQTAILIETGLTFDQMPSGRCAAVDPDSGEVIDFVVADPALDAITEEHPVGGDKACQLYATNEAKIGWKLDAKRGWLARVVIGDRKGTVAEVAWVKPDAIPEGAIEDSYAKLGDEIEALKLTDIASEGTVKL